jgi:hypothetical protein
MRVASGVCVHERWWRPGPFVCVRLALALSHGDAFWVLVLGDTRHQHQARVRSETNILALFDARRALPVPSGKKMFYSSSRALATVERELPGGRNHSAFCSGSRALFIATKSVGCRLS